MSLRRIRVFVAALAAALPAAAHAQPACAPGILSDYLALTGACTLGGVAFSGFQATFGAFNVPALLSTVNITPFSVGGQVGFNLALNQPLSVQEASAVGLGFAERSFEFDFTASGAGAGAMIGASPFSLFTASVSAAPGGPATGAEATALMKVASEAADDSVTITTGVRGGASQVSSCAVFDPSAQQVTCVPLVTAPFADGMVSLVGRVDAWGAVNAPASASLPNLGVAIILGPNAPLVTPEPASLPLLASGAGALGLVGARRRRRARVGAAA